MINKSWIAIIFLLFFSGCQHELELESEAFPYLFTEGVSNVSATGFNAKGTFYELGAVDIDSYGFVLGLFDPTIGRSEHVFEISDIPFKDFEAKLEYNLTPKTSYEVRAYAICGETEIYGNNVQFSF